MPGGATAAREMTGAGAFDAAKASAQMTSSTTLAAATMAVSSRMDQVVAEGKRELRNGGGGRQEFKRVGGRLLAMRNGVWTDVAHRDSLRVTAIAPFSRAWFALVEARPTLAAALSAGTPLLLAGRRASLQVADGGSTEWAAGALDRFLREFEGR